MSEIEALAGTGRRSAARAPSPETAAAPPAATPPAGEDDAVAVAGAVDGSLDGFEIEDEEVAPPPAAASDAASDAVGGAETDFDEAAFDASWAQAGIEPTGGTEVEPPPGFEPRGLAPAVEDEEAATAAEEAADDGDDAAQLFGHYRLLDRIAVGGMAEVWKARMSGVEGFQKTVAIKKILPQMTDNSDFIGMFIDEAKLAAQLNHPNITHIYDLGKIGRDYYIAMEYVDGPNLRNTLTQARRKGMPLPAGMALLIAARLASALDYAHRKRDFDDRELELVHRDVSPQNVLLSYEGDIKLCDFGIVKAVSKATHTQMGALKGKLQYMSPEQAWGRTVDARSDIFSLGSLLFEMLTGERLFAGDNEISVLDAVRECYVRSPREIDPSVPQSAERIVLKALAKEPDDRYENAGEMQQELEAILYGLRPTPSQADLGLWLRRLDEATGLDDEARPGAAVEAGDGVDGGADDGGVDDGGADDGGVDDSGVDDSTGAPTATGGGPAPPPAAASPVALAAGAGPTSVAPQDDALDPDLAATRPVPVFSEPPELPEPPAEIAAEPAADELTGTGTGAGAPPAGRVRHRRRLHRRQHRHHRRRGDRRRARTGRRPGRRGRGRRTPWPVAAARRHRPAGHPRRGLVLRAGSRCLRRPRLRRAARRRAGGRRGARRARHRSRHDRAAVRRRARRGRRRGRRGGDARRRGRGRRRRGTGGRRRERGLGDRRRRHSAGHGSRHGGHRGDGRRAAVEEGGRDPQPLRGRAASPARRAATPASASGGGRSGEEGRGRRRRRRGRRGWRRRSRRRLQAPPMIACQPPRSEVSCPQHGV